MGCWNFWPMFIIQALFTLFTCGLLIGVYIYYLHQAVQVLKSRSPSAVREDLIQRSRRRVDAEVFETLYCLENLPRDFAIRMVPSHGQDLDHGGQWC